MRKLKGFFVLALLVGAIGVGISAVNNVGTIQSYSDWGDPMGTPNLITLNNHTDSFKVISANQKI